MNISVHDGLAADLVPFGALGGEPTDIAKILASLRPG